MACSQKRRCQIPRSRLQARLFEIRSFLGRLQGNRALISDQRTEYYGRISVASKCNVDDPAGSRSRRVGKDNGFSLADSVSQRMETINKQMVALALSQVYGKK